MSCQVFIETYGCQMNVYDSELVSSILVAGGFKIVNELKQADVTLINTCSVRENANNKVLLIIVININGTKTINHEIIPKPLLHKILSTNVNIIITRNFINAELYNCLNVSMIICVRENPIYTIAGAQICIIYIIYYFNLSPFIFSFFNFLF